MPDEHEPTKVDRSGLRMLMLMFAAARAAEAANSEGGEPRYGAASNSIKNIAGTMDQVDEAVMMKLMSVNQSSHGLLLQLITVRLRAVGFELPCFEDAKSFFEPISAQIDGILRDIRARMN